MSRRATVAYWILVLAPAPLIAAGVAAGVASPRKLDAGAVTLLGFVVTVAAFSAVGAMVARRRPRNPVGWLMLVVGFCFAVVIATSLVSEWALRTGALPQTLGELINVGGNVWVLALGIIGVQLPLRLPDGRLPSPRWRWFAWAMAALTLVAFVGMCAQPGRIEDVPGTSNPVHTPWLAPLASAFVGVIAGFLGGLVGLVVRYRRSSPHDKAQLRWVAYGGAVFVVVYLATLPNGGSGHGIGIAITTISQAAFAALPISIGVAMLRRDLYDIDVVVNRTLVYGGLTATVAATYAATVLLGQLVLDGLTGGSSSLAIAVSTLAAAAVLRPARGRIQRLVDRRFFRRRYDARRTLERFAVRVRDEVGLDTLSAELRAVVGETMQPAHVSVWLTRPPGTA